MGFGVIDPTLNANGVSPLLANMRMAIGNTFNLGKVLKQMGTMHSSIGARNAYNQALQQTAMPLALGHVTMQDLLNKRMAINNQYLPQKSQANINYLNALSQFMPEKMQIALGKMQQGEEQLLKTPQGYERYNVATHQVTPITDGNGKPVMPLTGGQLVRNIPGIGWVITQTGVGPSTTGQTQAGNINANNAVEPANLTTSNALSAATPQQLQQGAQGNLVRSPAAPSSRWSTGGNTLVDTHSGNAVSVPTKQMTTRMQRGLVGEDLVAPIIQKIFGDVSPELGGALGAGKRGLQHAEKFFGENTPALNHYISAKETEIPQSADQLLNAYGLNATGQNREAMQQAIQVHWNDTKFSYAQRIADTIAGLLYRGGRYQQLLKGGIPLQGKPDKAAVVQALSDKIYQELLQPHQSAQANDPLGIL